MPLAGALALSSRHPLAAAVAAAAGARAPIAAHEFPGQGVTALVDGKRVKLGSIAFCKAEAEAAPVARAYPDASLIAFRGPKRAVVFAARQALARRRAGNRRSARRARPTARNPLRRPRAGRAGRGRGLGVADWAAGLKPADKIARLKALKGRGPPRR